MKQNIHPKWYPEAKVIVNGEVVMTVGSTRPELSVEIWSGTHPFYTGQQRLVDTEGQVERFMRRLQRREDIVTETQVQRDSQSPLALPVDELPITSRAAKALQSAGIMTVSDIVTRLEEGDDALLAVNGFGQKALIDVKKFLRSQELV